MNFEMASQSPAPHFMRHLRLGGVIEKALEQDKKRKREFVSGENQPNKRITPLVRDDEDEE